MLTVLELKEKSTLPQEFLDVLPERCDTCGTLLEITPSLSALSCPNKACMDRAVQRLVALLKDVGVKNMGDSKCRLFLENFGQTNPYVIFMYEPSDGPLYEGCSMDFSQAIYDQVQARRTMALWEYVRAGNLPGLRDDAYKLFGSYESLEEFFDDMEDKDSGGITFIQDLLGIKAESGGADVSAVSVKATKIYAELTEHKEELFQALDFIIFPSVDLPEINICMSQSVGGKWGKKEAYERYLKEEFGDVVTVNVFKSLSAKCHALIWSKEGTPTSKVTKANDINASRLSDNAKNAANGVEDRKELLLIMTGDEFVDYLRATYTHT